MQRRWLSDLRAHVKRNYRGMPKSIILGVCVLLLVRTGNSFSDDENWPIIRAAAKAASENLRSGLGTGTYRHFTRKSPTDEWVLTTEAKVSTYFTDGKYHVDLKSDSEKKEYDRNGMKLSRRIESSLV
jgi:hypothetical protein